MADKLPSPSPGFGAMRITGKGIWGEPQDHDEAIRVLRRSLELGIDFIDTADSYGPEVSERLIAEALYPYPKGLVIATKAGLRPACDRARRVSRRALSSWCPRLASLVLRGTTASAMTCGRLIRSSSPCRDRAGR